MKLIEKMAYEDFKNQSKEAPYQNISDVYGAGFRAAREMAAQVLKEWDISWYEEDTKLAAQVHDRWTKIEKLAEEEV